MADDIEGILDDLDAASHDGTVTLGEMSEALGHRGAAPFLIVPPLIEISPIGGIPGVPTFLALVIAIFAAQIAFGRDEPHVPGLLARRGVTGERLRDATETLRPLAARLDRMFTHRLRWLTTAPQHRIAMLVVLGLCLIVPPLELVPFASTLPMGAVLLFGLALLFRDGLLMIAAYVASVGALGGIAWLLASQGLL